MTTPATAFSGTYDYRLVALSVFIAILAAYAALDLAGRVTAAQGRLRFLWLAGGAIAMGMGIWSMHYVGMLAYTLPVRVLYDWPTVLLSLLAAITAAAIALFVVSRDKMGILSIGVGGLMMGAGIAAMHYIGMDAMRLPAMCHYSLAIVSLSVVLAVVISLVALWLTFHLRSETQSFGWRRIASTILMGAAIPVMHYTGMAAVTFIPMSSVTSLDHAVEITSLGVIGVVSVSITILAIAILTSLFDRRFSIQALELQRSEQRFRQLAESAQIILWRGDVSLRRFSYVNQMAGELLGYRVADWIGIPEFWLDHIHAEDRLRVQSECKAAADTGTRSFEHRMVGNDGRIFWLRTAVRLVRDNDENEIVGVMADITSRKNAEAEAEAASCAKTELLAEIERLNAQLKSENSRMYAELEVTRHLQQMMLPRSDELRSIANLDISGSMDVATEVGGDYYDVVPNGKSVLFGIGDVTGHGLQSGLIAIMLQTAVRTLLASGHYESHKFFEVLNRVVYDTARRMKCDHNLTLSLMNYHDKSVTISGQHEEVLIVRDDGSLERHDTLDLGFPLGLEPGITSFIGETTVPLQSGDVVVVYTDGVTEAVNEAGVAYGMERLCEVLKTSHKKLAHGIREAVLKSVHDHVGGQRLLDDLSLLVIKHA